MLNKNIYSRSPFPFHNNQPHQWPTSFQKWNQIFPPVLYEENSTDEYTRILVKASTKVKPFKHHGYKICVSKVRAWPCRLSTVSLVNYHLEIYIAYQQTFISTSCLKYYPKFNIFAWFEDRISPESGLVPNSRIGFVTYTNESKSLLR